MEIPKIIIANNRKYELVKEYPNHISYRDVITGARTSFQRYDLGMIKETEKTKSLVKYGVRKYGW